MSMSQSAKSLPSSEMREAGALSQMQRVLRQMGSKQGNSAARGGSAESVPARAGKRVSASAALDVRGAGTVSTDWLHNNLSNEKLAVLDCSWYLPSANRDPRAEFMKSGRIPGAQFFDTDSVKDIQTDLPHMLPPPAAFAAAMDALAIRNDTAVIVYDCATTGLFSAARAFWMLRAFGHSNCAVLDGGFQKWKSERRPVEQDLVSEEAVDASSTACAAAQRGDANQQPSYSASMDKSLVRNKEEVLNRVANSMSEQLVDARPADRFRGEGSEPNPDSKVGRIPNSSNLPAMSLLDPNTGELKSEKDIRNAFKDANVDLSSNSKPIVASCGSGMTACILALGLYKIGRPDVAVYDGSWREWGTAPDTPVAKSTEQ